MSKSIIDINGTQYEVEAAAATMICEVTLPDGRLWRLFVGNGGAAFNVRQTGLVAEHTVTHVVNCVAAEVPFRYFNTRGGIMYINLITRDWPRPVSVDSPERPDFTNIPEMMASSLIPTGRDKCVFVHCAYGRNRSVTAAAVGLCGAFRGHPAFATFDTSVASIAALKDVEVFPVYRQWGIDFLASQHTADTGIGAGTVAFPGTISPFPPPLVTGPEASRPPAPKPAAGTRGAGVIATHDYHVDGSPACLAAFFVRERPWDHRKRAFEAADAYCMPLEGRKVGESAPECGARALFEELHLQGIDAAVLRGPGFVHADLTAAHVFVATQPGAETNCGGESGYFSREMFRARRADLQAMQQSGAAEFHGAHIGDHLETMAFVHVDVASLILAPDGHIYPRDQSGRPLDHSLRRFCVELLTDGHVQAALRTALGNFYARHPHLAPSKGPPLEANPLSEVVRRSSN